MARIRSLLLLFIILSALVGIIEKAAKRGVQLDLSEQLEAALKDSKSKSHKISARKSNSLAMNLTEALDFLGVTEQEIDAFTEKEKRRIEESGEEPHNYLKEVEEAYFKSETDEDVRKLYPPGVEAMPYKKLKEEIEQREKGLMTYDDNSPSDLSLLPGLTKEDMEELSFEELKALRLKHLPYLSRLLQKRNPHMRDPKPGEVTHYCWDHQFLIMRPCQAEEDGTVTLFDFDGNPMPMPEPKETAFYPKVNPDGTYGPAEGSFGQESKPFAFTETSSVRLSDVSEDIVDEDDEDEDDDWEEVDFGADEENADRARPGERYDTVSTKLDAQAPKFEETVWSKRTVKGSTSEEFKTSALKLSPDQASDNDEAQRERGPSEQQDASRPDESEEQVEPSGNSEVLMDDYFDDVSSSEVTFDEEALRQVGFRLARDTEEDLDKPIVYTKRDHYRLTKGPLGDTVSEREQLEDKATVTNEDDQEETLLEFVRRSGPGLEDIVFKKEDKKLEGTLIDNLKGDRAFEKLRNKYQRTANNRRSTTKKGARLQL